jgi:hypothetical protein
VTTYAGRPTGTITYQQWLLNRIAEPGMIRGPDVIDHRAWRQHLPGLNPCAELEQRRGRPNGTGLPVPVSSTNRLGNPNGRPKPNKQRASRRALTGHGGHGGPPGQTTHPAEGDSMASTVASLRPAFMADLDAAAEQTAAVMASHPATGSGVGAAARQAAAEQEMATVERWLAASSDVVTQLQREAELEAG